MGKSYWWNLQRLDRQILDSYDLGTRNENVIIKFTDSADLRGIINTQENQNNTQEKLNDLVKGTN